MTGGGSYILPLFFQKVVKYMAITSIQNVKAVLGITDTERDVVISMLIPLVEQAYLEIRNRAFETDENTGAIIYPAGSELTAIEMIGYELGKRGRTTGMKSESLGDYSYTKDDPSGGGYPVSIIQKIRRFVKFT